MTPNSFHGRVRALLSLLPLFSVLACQDQVGPEWTPPPQASLSTVTVQVATGQQHTCKLESDGIIHCWGASNAAAPANRPATTGFYTQVAAGNFHSCALRDDGVIECWGVGSPAPRPAVRPATTGYFVKVRAAYSTTCGVRDDGHIECFGGSSSINVTPTPPIGQAYTDVAIGNSHACALRGDGVIECWGQNFIGQAPPEVTDSAAFDMVTASYNYTCARMVVGTFKCWGLDQNGEATAYSGLGTLVSAGASHTCYKTNSGNTICFGLNHVSQLDVPTVGDVVFSQIAASADFTCGVANDLVRCWGSPGSAWSKSEVRLNFTSAPPAIVIVGPSYIVRVNSNIPLSSSPVLSTLTPAVCTIADSVMSFHSGGACTIAADYAGGTETLAAPQLTYTFAVMLMPPTNVTAAFASASSVNVTWQDHSNDEDNFELWRRIRYQDGSYGPWLLAALPAEDATSASDGVAAGFAYQYRVRGCNSAACSIWATSDLVTYETAPAAPTSVTSTAASSFRIDVSWVDGSSNESTFVVQRRTYTGAWSRPITLSMVPQNTVSYADESVATDATYQYRVQACNPRGCSPFVYGKRTVAQVPPATPTGLNAQRVGARIDLVWTPGSGTVDEFQIQRRVLPSGGSWTSFSAHATRPGGTSTHQDSAVASGSAYRYRIRACNSAGCSPWSASSPSVSMP